MSIVTGGMGSKLLVTQGLGSGDVIEAISDGSGDDTTWEEYVRRMERGAFVAEEQARAAILTTLIAADEEDWE
jgi:hypothetical protein